MRVHLGGHLSWYDADKRTWLELSLPAPLALRELAQQLGLPAAEIAITTVNRRVVELATASAADGDTVEFFSALSGG